MRLPRPKPSSATSSLMTDALAQLARKARLDPGQVAATRAWLAEQLVGAEFAKLGQGGHTESRVPLQRVFVDLPVSNRVGQTDQSTAVLFLEQLITTGARSLGAKQRDESSLTPPLDPAESSDDYLPGSEASCEPGQQEPVGFLLIGGPGQGKSTLGQLACQLHRAALLLPHRRELDHSARNVLDQFAPQDSKIAQHELALPTEPMLPLSIPLPDLSAWLAKSEEKLPGPPKVTPTLLRFIAEQASARQTDLNSQTLLAMTRAWPSLIFLDGFDEVGSQDDRHRIVTAIQELLSDLNRRGARVQILATTRPQGYAGELERIGAPLAVRYLIPLGRDTALRYAERLVEAKIQGADSREKVLARLRQAADEPAMARLMTSPLQVTILAALVQHGGSAPRERWTLFKSYFDFTYRREIERDSYASPLLARQRGHIERVHLRAALLLQVESEEAGSASAQLSRERLEEITDTVLREDEVAEPERRDLVRQILDAAERRLVFLVEPELGRFGFEIRSLQEFLAAWALTEGGEAEIEARLLQTAPAPMFRNVLLFVASRLYSEAHHLRDRFAEHLCPALDEVSDDALLRLSHAGALLALETLEEGAVLTQPKRARALMLRAVGLLDLPPGVEHARLARVTNDDTRDVLLKALRERILDAATEGRPDPLAAWVCLTECCNRERTWAMALWAETWPEAREPGRILEAINAAVPPVRLWLAEQLETDADRLPPESVVWGGRTKSDETFPGWFGLLWGGYIHQRLQKNFVSLVGALKRNRLLSLPTSPPPFAWRRWCAVAAFDAAPSAKSLMEAISNIRTASTSADWSELAWRAPWPLAACLRWAESAQDLIRLEEMISEGVLGDLTDWLKAEGEWKRRVGEADAVRQFLRETSEDSPWRLSSLQVAPPLAALHYVDFRVQPGTAANLLTEATVCFRSALRTVNRLRLAELCFELLSQASAKHSVSSEDASAWLKTSKRTYDWLIPKPRPLSTDTWLELLHMVPEDHPMYMRVAGAIQVAIAYPSVPTLLSAALTEALYNAPLAKKYVHIATLAEKLRGISFESVTSRVYATLFRLLAGESDHELIESLVQAVPSMSPWAGNLAQRVLVDPPRGAQIKIGPDALLEAMMVHQAANGWRLANADTLLRNVRHALQSRRSNLANPAVWERLGLPEPFPLSPVSHRIYTVIPELPVVLQSLDIRDLKGVGELSLKLAPPAHDRGQWTVLLGPNGAGKTTLLRALVLSLRNLRDPAIWPKGAFSSPWVRAGASDAARIIVRIDDVERTVHIRPNHSGRPDQSPEQTRPRLFPLFAYGCRRGSALGGTGRAVDTSDDGGPEVATLFDEGAGLVHAETWLIQWEGDALKSPKSRVIYDAIRDALCRLLGVTSIEIKDRRLWVAEPGKLPLPLEAMSDGYLTTAGWFIDLVARWIDLASRHGFTIDGDFLERMTGLVLLDEIDLHLHPLWQLQVIRRTRALVPRMSFVVTTHNPLTLVGARPEEIWILSMKEGMVVANQSQEAPMLLTGGQIFNRYFGIENVFPAEIGAKLHRYGFLSGYAGRSDAEQTEMELMRAELSDAGIEPGWDEVRQSVGQEDDLSVFFTEPTST